MKPKEIQELLDFIAHSGLAEVNIETEEFKINVKRNAAAAAITQLTQALPQVIQHTTLPAHTETPVQTQTTPVAPQEAGGNGKQVTIKSPMIGTVYRSSSPETPSLVN